jgi:hypothetical protein
MLISAKNLINLIKMHEVLKVPDIEINEDEQAVILYCTPKLFEYIKSLKEKGFQELSILEVAKIYKEVQSLLNRKDNNENGNETKV